MKIQRPREVVVFPLFFYMFRLHVSVHHVGTVSVEARTTHRSYRAVSCHVGAWK